MEYDSLQAYLEAHLKVATNITPEVIAKLKKQWRRDYVARYNKEYQNNHVQVTFRLTCKQYKKLLDMSAKHALKPTVYCRRLVLGAINGNGTVDVQPLKLLVMEIIDMIEEAEYESDELHPEEILPLLIKIQKGLS